MAKNHRSPTKNGRPLVLSGRGRGSPIQTCPKPFGSSSLCRTTSPKPFPPPDRNNPGTASPAKAILIRESANRFLQKPPSHCYTIRLVDFAPSSSLPISGCILVGILLKANDGELKGAVYFHCLPPKAEVDFIHYPSNLVSFDEARALAENLLANAQCGYFKGYRWERAAR